MNEIYGYILIDKQGRIIQYHDNSESLNALLFAKEALSDNAIDSQVLSITKQTYNEIEDAYHNQNANAIKGYRFAPDLVSLLDKTIW